MRHLLTILALFIVVAVGAAQADDAPGVTDESILIGMTADLTGNIAFVGQQGLAGVRLYFDHVNASGGVHGRRLELRIEDDGYQPPRTMAAVRKLLNRDGVFCFVANLGTAPNVATFPLVERERVPVVMPLTLSSQMSTPAKRYVFGIDPNYVAESWLLVQHLVETVGTEGVRLAAFYQDDDFGRDGLKGLRDAAAHYGLPIVAEEGHKRAAVDFSAQALNLRQADPTHVVLITINRESAALMRETQQAGWQPQFLATIPAADAKTVQLAGDAADGLIGLGMFDYDSDVASMQLYRDLLDEHAPGEPLPSIYHTLAFGGAQTLVEGLRRAGRELTREKLVAALESLDHWQGPVMPPVTYGPKLRGGQFASAFLVRADVESQTFVRASDWFRLSRPATLTAQATR